MLLASYIPVIGTVAVLILNNFKKNPLEIIFKTEVKNL